MAPVSIAPQDFGWLVAGLASEDPGVGMRQSVQGFRHDAVPLSAIPHG